MHTFLFQNQLSNLNSSKLLKIFFIQELTDGRKKQIINTLLDYNFCHVHYRTLELEVFPEAPP